MRNIAPIFEWLPAYRREWLPRDLAAGAAAWAVLASATLTAVAAGGDRLSLLVLLTLPVGAVYLAFHLLRFGWMADVVPDPVLKGLVEGAIWITIVKQIPELLGLVVEMPARDFPGKLAAIGRALPENQRTTTLVALVSLVALWLLRRFARRVPGPLVVPAGSITLAWLLGLDRAGVAVAGRAVVGAPRLALPRGLDLGRLVELVPGVLIGLVLALFMLAHDIHDPVVAAVGRTPSGAFVDLDQRGKAAEIPGMLIVRCYAPIVFLDARVLTARGKSLVTRFEESGTGRA